MTRCLETLKPFIDKTIIDLGKTEFRADPIGGNKYSRQTSIISSAYKRHGKILERALLEGLKEKNHIRVWNEPEFWVSADAERMASPSKVSDCLKNQLVYGEKHKKTEIDIVVYDDTTKKISAFEVKRGNGDFDRGKKDSLLSALLATHMLLKSYCENAKNLEVSSYEVKIIFYYGVISLPKGLSLTRNDLDNYFGFPLVAAVESVNSYFQDKLFELLETSNQSPNTAH